MNFFKTKGFDTLIGINTVVAGSLHLSGATIIDGIFRGQSITADPSALVKTKTTLLVNGSATCESIILADDLTVCGTVAAKEIRVEGTFAVKSDAKVTAGTIYYRTLVIEPGAVILAELKHLDHVSEGEQV